MTPLIIRPATEADLERVGDIGVSAYEGAGQLEPGAPYIATLRDTSARMRDALLLVAERAGMVVGTVTICPYESPFREVAFPGELEFRFLAVEPVAWGTGVGSQLVAWCEQHARDIGATALCICVRDNNLGAAAMYERMGFTRVPERDWTPSANVHLLALTRQVPWPPS